MLADDSELVYLDLKVPEGTKRLFALCEASKGSFIDSGSGEHKISEHCLQGLASSIEWPVLR